MTTVATLKGNAAVEVVKTGLPKGEVMDTKNNECRPGSVCARSARGLGGCGAGGCKPPTDRRQVREDSQGLGEPGRLSPTPGVEGRKP